MPVTGFSRVRPRPSKPRSDTLARSLARYAKRQAAHRPNDDDHDSGNESGAESDDDDGGSNSDDESSTSRWTPPASAGPPTATSRSATTITIVVKPTLSVTRESSSSSRTTSATTPSSDTNLATADSTTIFNSDISMPSTLAPTPPSSDKEAISPQGNLSNSSSSPSPGAIAGIAVAVLVVVAIAAFFLIRRRAIQKRVNRRSLWTVRPFSGRLASERGGSSSSPSDTSSGNRPGMVEAGYSGFAAIPNPYNPSRPPAARTIQSSHPSSRPGSQTSQVTAQTIPSFYVRGNSTYSDPFEDGVPAATAAEGSVTTKTVKHFYIPERPDEMAVQLGTELRVLAEYDDGWALCEDPQTRQQGMVPLACFGGPHVRVDSPSYSGAPDAGDAVEDFRPPTALVDKFRLSKRASSLASPFVTAERE